MAIAETLVPIRLGEKDYNLRFNANAMAAFEEKTGKFFLNTVSDLFDAAYPTGDLEKPQTNPFEIVRRVSMIDLRALLWAALHEYDAQDEPVWPLTIGQIGRLFRMQDVVPVFISFLNGQSANSPTKEEMGESQAEAKNPSDKSLPQPTVESGGASGIALPEDAFT